jgi:hypothetical protein
VWFAGDDLYGRPVLPREWLPLLGQPGYIEQAATNLLVATFKSGKTTLLTQCLYDWLKADQVVLMITEESAAQWTTRLQEFAGPGLYDDLGYYSGSDDGAYIGNNGPLSNLIVFPAMGWSGRDIQAKIIAFADRVDVEWGIYAKEYMARLVIILDTTKLLHIEDENDAAKMNLAITPFIQCQQATGSTVIIVHHTRKGDGKDGEEIAGSHVTGALVDNIITVRREQSDPTRRSVHARGRFVEDVTGLYERTEVQNVHGVGTGRHTLQWIGQKKAVTVKDTKARVAPLLPYDRWVSRADILSILTEPRPSDDTLERALAELVEQGYAVADPPGTLKAPGKTRKWHRTA